MKARQPAEAAKAFEAGELALVHGSWTMTFPDGLPPYERMGFQHVMETATWSLARDAAVTPVARPHDGGT